MVEHVQNLKDLVISVLTEHSATDIVALKVGDRCALAEHMIVASGNSPNHVKSLAEYIKKKVSPYGKVHIEGLKNKNWVVLSMDNILVHIFMKAVRDYYSIENLWDPENYPLPTRQCIDPSSTATTY